MSKTTIESIIKNTESIFNPATGEIEKERISSEEVSKTIHKAEPPYVKLYIQDILYLQDMPKGLTNITYALAKRSTYADPTDINKGLYVILNSFIRQQICEECGYKNIHSLNNDITKLVKGNIIKRIGTGTYQMNPYLFGKGEWKDIDNIRMTWTYDIKGRTFGEVAFGYKTEEDGQIVMDLDAFKMPEAVNM